MPKKKAFILIIKGKKSNILIKTSLLYIIFFLKS